jgi:hypothetical protein
MKKTLLSALALLVAAPALADCNYRAVEVQAQTPALYVGAGARMRVEFDNYKLDGEVDSFPEPPLRIRPVQGGKACEVDGGIWLRNAVLLDASEQRLLVQSFSGSAGELTFYDTSSCAQLARIELPEASWELQGEQLVIGRECSEAGLAHCSERKAHTLNEQCLPL